MNRKNLYYLIGFILGSFVESRSTFSTVDDLLLFTRTHQEELKPDSLAYSDPLSPTFYSSYARSLKLKNRFFNFMRSLIGIGIRVDWSDQYFEAIMKKACKEQAEFKNMNGEIVGRPEHRYVIWGDLCGSVHSFVRCLDELKRKNFIDQNLRLMPDYYMIFTGDVIGSAAYNLEILSIIFQLIVLNPGRIIYLKGRQERQFNWHNFNTYRELEIKVPKHRISSFVSNLDLFFENLLGTLKISYIDQHQQKRDVLFSYEGFEKLKSAPTNEILIQVKSNKGIFAYTLTNGLSLRCPECGITTWTIFSAPTYVSQEFYKFYNDSFCILEMASNGYDWLISHFYRRFDGKGEFDAEFFNFLTGQKFESEKVAKEFLKEQKKYLPVVRTASLDHGNQFIFGSYLDLSGSIKNIGEDLKRGLSLRFNKENIEYGGINGRFLRLVALDDRYNQTLTLDALIKLKNDFKTNLLVNGLGTRPLQTAMDFASKENMKILFPYTGASIGRQENLKNIVNLRASYADEAEALVDYGVNTLRKNRFVIFYQDDAYGRAGRDPAKKLLVEKYKITDILEVSHSVGSLQLDKAAEEIIKFGPSAILFFSIEVVSAELIEKIGIKSLMNVALLAVSFMSHSFTEFLKTRGLSSVLSQVLPNSHGDTPIAQECRDTLKMYMPSVDINADLFEGYVSASLLVEAIKIIGSDVTSEKLLRYFESLKNVNFKGLKLNFNSETRQLMHNVWLDVGKKDWIIFDMSKNNQ
ncbi:TPA: hypothetical protein DIC20_03300 [Candidatus Dependentiae bacterium]|nr:MAG: hypothetical protein US03_C0001G0050 [candidate division TM6 bacterium GW2011_GWF2_36_131]KKQ03814.1 MAG: hypothetical protein US13_C0001G0154 [candidate division TM6 bacterium GW2011_GWE2_36_25]KKQ19960.1 MAG: hypothetical protein US32_C0003G0077 [candidate division TM6 bacterium GW2011_GWA2_36_9]HBR70582.1 hypothetical protein [Candidatus Dependentiae bacterium]HCU00702.1 hypothetical protein [Candidatus Dependentiae bacterium]